MNNEAGGRVARLVISLLEEGRPMTLTELVQAGATRSGVHRLASAGRIHRVSTGVYRLAGASKSPHGHLAELCCRIPSAIVILGAAADFHGLTGDRKPIVVAVPQGRARSIKDTYPDEIDVRHWRSRIAFQEGVHTHVIDGVDVKITSPERTVVDLIRFSDLNPKRTANTKSATRSDQAISIMNAKCSRGCNVVNHREVQRIAERFEIGPLIQKYIDLAGDQ